MESHWCTGVAVYKFYCIEKQELRKLIRRSIAGLLTEQRRRWFRKTVLSFRSDDGLLQYLVRSSKSLFAGGYGDANARRGCLDQIGTF